MAYKVIISGGGTGGHIYPGIAIAAEVMRRNASNKVLFVGALGRMEMHKVPAAGFEIKGLPIVGLQRNLSLKNLLLPFKLLKSLWLARGIIKNYRPNIVVGVGGYASAPTLRVASSLGVTTLLQEQNSYAGIANKWLAKAATKVCVAYPNMDAYFEASKIVLTGNPVRSSIVNATCTRDEALLKLGLNEAKKTLLIVGGSLGARSINNAIASIFDQIINDDIQVIWQTGNQYYDRIIKTITPHKMAIVKEFIVDMHVAYAAADVVISRAGALSISELCIAGKPIILVPSPNVAEDHQTKNAQALVDANAALMLKDDTLNTTLKPLLYKLLRDESLQLQLSTNIKKLAIDNAAARIVNEIEACIL